MQFIGKTVIVTGSTKGIGKAIAMLFAANGANVVITGRNRERGDAVVAGIAAQGGVATFVAADLAQEQDVENLILTARRKYGGIDVLVNNAAPTESIVTDAADKPIADLTTEDFDYIMKAGLYGVFWAIKYAIPSMIERGGGSIINISSAVATLAISGFTAYTCSKGAMHALTRLVALDYGRHHIRCNCVVVGGFIAESGVMDEALNHPIAGPGFRRASMTGELGKPADVAALTYFLASDAAAYITAALIPCDGGLTAKADMTDVRAAFAEIAKNAPPGVPTAG